MIKTTLSLLIASTLVVATDQLMPKAEVKTTESEIVTVTDVNEEEATPIEVVPAKLYKWDCVGCNVQEQMALEAFQDRGITDRLALATLMGNIKHESQFKPDICDGGAQ